ncbi:MAG: hypothetical protein Q9157_000318 [Trypethelium eluteriae]
MVSRQWEIEACKRYTKARGQRNFDEALPDVQQEIEQFATSIDKVVKAGKNDWLNSDLYRRGGRRYVQDPEGLNLLKTWRKAAETRVEAMENKNDFLPWCPARVGYTYDAQKRRTNHQQHMNSSPLMNLIEAICMKIFGDDQLYMEFVVLFEAFDRDQAAPMEHILSQFAMAYVHLGGFNGTCRGFSCESVRNVPIWAYDQLGELQREERRQVDEIMEKRLKLEKLDQELARLDVELAQATSERDSAMAGVFQRQERALEELRQLDDLDNWPDKYIELMKELPELKDFNTGG